MRGVFGPINRVEGLVLCSSLPPHLALRGFLDRLRLRVVSSLLVRLLLISKGTTVSASSSLIVAQVASSIVSFRVNFLLVVFLICCLSGQTFFFHISLLF